MKVKFQHKVIISLATLIVIPLTTFIAVNSKNIDFIKEEYSIIRKVKSLELELEKTEIILKSAELVDLLNQIEVLKEGSIKYEYLDTLGCLLTAFSNWDDVIDVTGYFAQRRLNEGH